MPDVMSDRRNSPRYSIVLLATISEIGSESKVSARTSDVSRTGCYIDTLNPFPKGSTVRVRLTNGGETFEAKATVMYVSPGLGMGVQFQEPVEAKQLAILDSWLEKSSHLRL
jgi:hypothetical protein